MYYWNVSKLAEDLREGRVDERERLEYFLATFIAWNIVVQLFIYSVGPFNTDRVIFAAINLTASVFGIVFCYRVNKRGDNADFIPRMICLGWPVGIRAAAMMASLCLGVGVLHSVPLFPGAESFWSAVPGKVWDELWGNIQWFWFVWFVLYFYWTISGYLALVARVKDSKLASRAKEPDWSGGEVALAVLGGVGVPIIAILAGSVALDHAGHGPLASLLFFSAIGLWILLFAAVLTWLRRRPTNHP